MSEKNRFLIVFLPLLLMLVWALPTSAGVRVQCPGDTNGDAQWTGGEVQPPNTNCKHVVGTDGFINMADGSAQYIFSFRDATGTLPGTVLSASDLGAEFSAPPIVVKEAENFYLTLTTRHMVMRPDLFDAHTVHFHGYPNASSVFDGEPMASFAVNQSASLTYYYRGPGPGTYMYHCHNEASEHMQMGMLGSLYVTPLQDGTVIGGCTSATYAYNDGDGTTCYDVDYIVQLASFDPNFHAADLNIQPPPFAEMSDTYPMLNGRGYPDTINPSTTLGGSPENNGYPSQKIPTRIIATQGDRILLRISSLATVRFSTLSSSGIPMQVVGRDAKILQTPGGTNLYYKTNSVTLGGGESVDVILDTTNIQPGTYFLYSRNLDELNNDQQEFGGMMTEIVVNAI